MNATPPTDRSAAPYDHRFHAGNVGDVLKHAALVAVLRGLVAEAPALHALDTHAGGGRYRLKPTGEWTAGIGRLDAGLPADAAEAVHDYLAAVAWDRRADHGGGYPGSPAILRAGLRPQDRLSCVERLDEPRGELEALFADDPQVAVHAGDGLARLIETAATAPANQNLFALVDPAYAEKQEWSAVADALITAGRGRPQVRLMLWYPIKSAARPNALKAKLRNAGLAATAIELCSSPLHLETKRRNALNGSGVILVRPPAGALARLAAALPALGERLATRGAWTSAVEAWGDAP